MNHSLAFFISPHGYGHAARSCAVIEQLHYLRPELTYHIFTTVPEWFFKTSLPEIPYEYHNLITDIGLVQPTPMQIDFEKTLAVLGQFIPFKEKEIQDLSRQLTDLGCLAVICDISSLGIVSAKKVNLPVVLLENFTWDWIYEFYIREFPGFEPFIDFFQSSYRQADFHIQAKPVSRTVSKAFVCEPISRMPRLSPSEIRLKLGITEYPFLILVSMGGIPTRFNFTEKLKIYSNYSFVVPNDIPAIRRHENIIELPHHSGFYHPDLVHAADAVICKLGYSTISEIYMAGIPLMYVSRDNFRESIPMKQFADEQLSAIEIKPADFHSDRWISKIPELYRLSKTRNKKINGAEQAADFVIGNLF